MQSIYEGFLRVLRSSLPTVAAVNGPAVGAGLNLALACDVRLAGMSARFDTRFLRIGLHPGGGHAWMLDRAVGPQAAAAMVLFGEALDGARAAEVGLAWACHPDDELLERSIAFARAGRFGAEGAGGRRRCDAARSALAARLRHRDRNRGRAAGLVARTGLVQTQIAPLIRNIP